MLARLRATGFVIALAAALAAFAAAPTYAQVTTGTPGGGTGSTVETTGPGGALTLGSGGTGTFSTLTGGGSESEFEEEPLPHTGGGDLAFAAGSLLAATGLGLRWIAARRR